MTTTRPKILGLFGIALLSAFAPGRGAGAQLKPIAPRLRMSDARALPRGDSACQRGADVAYGGGGFLIVWQDGYHGLGGRSDILGLRLDRSGQPLDKKPIEICTHRAVQTEPTVAFCAGTFLVAWSDLRNGKDYDLYANLIDPDGKVKARDGFALSAAGRSQHRADATSNGVDTFFVVWQDHRAGKQAEVYGARIPAGKTAPADGAGRALVPGASPAVTFSGTNYFVYLGDSGCLVGADGRVVVGKKRLWNERRSTPGDAASAGGRSFGFFNTSSWPDPWGWGGNGAVVGVSITPGGESPEFAATSHSWYDLARNQADRKVRNVVDCARWRNHAGWPMGMPGGFKGSHEGTWPSGRPAAAYNGRSLIVVWPRARFADRYQLGTRELYLKRVLDGWACVDEPKLKIVAGDADAAMPALAADGKGTALLAYERQQAGGGVAVEYRLLREEPDRTPPALAHTRQLAPTRIALVFDEPLDPASVRDASFEIDGLEVKSARFNDRPDALARQVVIETAKATPGRTYRLTVAGLKDRAGNATKPRPLELVVQPGTASPIPFIDRWLILGPFPRDWKMQYVDPAGVRPSPGKAVEIGGRKVTWKTGPMKWQSLLSFNRAFGKPENRIAYAHVYVYSHRARKVMLRLDSNDGNRAWLNGRQVNFDPAERGRGIHTHTNEVTVSLAKGWNRLLVAVGNRRGYWLLVAQFTDASRQPIRDLTYRLEDPLP